MVRLPDFIIIGAMKCGTSSLHEQLALRPGIFMSRPKEPNFFSDGSNFERGLDWYGALFSEACAAAANPSRWLGASVRMRFEVARAPPSFPTTS